ncbi:RBBP9/YdeN family alpha/beta hydrolase [Patescibacteria group bacterium]
MRNALLLHGKPSKEGYYNPDRESQSNEHWFPWLQHELIIRDILTQTPEWPKPFEPVYKDWLNLFRRFEVNEESTLVGHSCGGGFLIRWLSDTDIKIDKLILVAPWLDPENTIQDKTFFDFKIDKNLKNKVNEIHILSSDDDSPNVLKSVKTLKGSIDGYKYHEFKKYGHFCYGDMNTREFPELLELII